MRLAHRAPPAPTAAVTVHPNHRAGPQAHQFRPESRVGHFQRDAANVFIGEEIRASELKVVKGTRVEEKGIAAPARKEAIVAGLRHLCLPSHRDRRSLDDNLPALARPGGLRALQAAQRRRLRPAPNRREAHLVCDIGDGIAVRVDLDLVERLGREGLGGSRSRLESRRRTGARP